MSNCSLSFQGVNNVLAQQSIHAYSLSHHSDADHAPRGCDCKGRVITFSKLEFLELGAAAITLVRIPLELLLKIFTALAACCVKKDSEHWLGKRVVAANNSIHPVTRMIEFPKLVLGATSTAFFGLAKPDLNLKIHATLGFVGAHCYGDSDPMLLGGCGTRLDASYEHAHGVSGASNDDGTKYAPSTLDDTAGHADADSTRTISTATSAAHNVAPAPAGAAAAELPADSATTEALRLTTDAAAAASAAASAATTAVATATKEEVDAGAAQVAEKQAEETAAAAVLAKQKAEADAAATAKAEADAASAAASAKAAREAEVVAQQKAEADVAALKAAQAKAEADAAAAKQAAEEATKAEAQKKADEEAARAAKQKAEEDAARAAAAKIKAEADAAAAAKAEAEAAKAAAKAAEAAAKAAAAHAQNAGPAPKAVAKPDATYEQAVAAYKKALAEAVAANSGKELTSFQLASFHAKHPEPKAPVKTETPQSLAELAIAAKKSQEKQAEVDRSTTHGTSVKDHAAEARALIAERSAASSATTAAEAPERVAGPSATVAQLTTLAAPSGLNLGAVPAAAASIAHAPTPDAPTRHLGLSDPTRLN